MENALVHHGEGLLVPGAHDRRTRRSACSARSCAPRTSRATSWTPARSIGVIEGPGVSTPVAQPVPWPARRHARPADGERTASRANPSPGCGSPPEHAGRASSRAGAPRVPEQRLTNADLEARVDTSDAWIVERTGIRERRIARSDETTASLAIEAGTAAIKQAGLTPDAIDLLVVATATPEQPIPHTGAFVGEGLGPALRLVRPRRRLRRASSTRSWRARRCSPPAALDHVLIVGAETLQPHRRPARPGHVHPLRRRRRRRRARPRAPTTARACSPGTSAATARRPGCSRSPPAAAASPRRPRPSPRATTTCGCRARRCSAARSASSSTRRCATLERAGVDAGEVDWFVPHQANAAHHRGRGQPARASRRRRRS